MITRTLRRTLGFPAGTLALGLAALVSSSAPSAVAQAPAAPKLEFPAPSPGASLKQRVGLTDIELAYSRPSLKSRVAFGPGGLAPYGQVWRTGANAATKISFSTPVKFGGQAVPAGTYALFSIPGKDEWTVILNNVVGQWGAYTYDQKNDVARATVKPITLGTPLESLTLNLHNLRDESATFSIAWGDVMVPVAMEFDVAAKLIPQIEAAMAGPDKPSANIHFAAAGYYYSRDHELPKALTWVDTAIAAQPDAFYMVLLKARIHAKLGQKEQALAAAKLSKELAAKAGGPVGAEYERLNDDLIASLR